MKKIVLLFTILFVSVISTACINNLAVQELNNLAKEYMSNGDAEKAVCRLRSSIDLDNSIFETHYNLGVALIELKEYKEAQESLENAIKLKPEFADSYYSLAVAYENCADDMLNKEEPEDGTDESIVQGKKNLSDEEKAQYEELLNKSIQNYNLYLEKQPDAQDRDKINSRIEYLNDKLNKLSPNSVSSEELGE